MKLIIWKLKKREFYRFFICMILSFMLFFEVNLVIRHSTLISWTKERYLRNCACGLLLSPSSVYFFRVSFDRCLTLFSSIPFFSFLYIYFFKLLSYVWMSIYHTFSQNDRTFFSPIEKERYCSLTSVFYFAERVNWKKRNNYSGEAYLSIAPFFFKYESIHDL